MIISCAKKAAAYTALKWDGHNLDEFRYFAPNANCMTINPRILVIPNVPIPYAYAIPGDYVVKDPDGNYNAYSAEEYYKEFVALGEEEITCCCK